jgi:AraC family transcriptional regulator of adaptative response/methylated-DNA-[protein]-cysteine methyltransferase
MNNYERIALVIRYLDKHHTSQPDLAALAGLIGLSPFHFHRLFSEWAGITPKDFLKCLSLTHARTLLCEGESVLNTALQVGLSGPGRLHDLCVDLVSASPGEMKRGGEGWTVSFGFAETPFGACLVGEGPRGVCHLSFIDCLAQRKSLAVLREEWPHARLMHDDSLAERIALRIFGGPHAVRDRRPLRAYVRGTRFQVRVWRALLQIPPGTLCSYKRLAEAIGCQDGARAVGGAVGRNPLAYLIPCHRVIRRTGVTGQYRWGRVRKCAMLAWEGASSFAALGRRGNSGDAGCDIHQS